MTKRILARRLRDTGRGALLLGLVLTAGGCASLNVNSDMTSMVDRTWRPETRPRRVLVYAATADIGARQSIEDRFAATSDVRATAFVRSYAVFFPGREYTDEEVQTTLDKYTIDAILILEGGEEARTPRPG